MPVVIQTWFSLENAQNRTDIICIASNSVMHTQIFIMEVANALKNVVSSMERVAPEIGCP